MGLEDVTSVLRRGVSPSYVETDGVLVLNQKCIRDQNVNFSLGRRHDASKKPVSGRTLELGDVLVNSTGVGTLGRVAQLRDFEEDIIVDSHVTVVRGDNTLLSPTYLGIALETREQEIESMGEGSTGQTELSRKRLGQLRLLVPQPEIIEKFDGVAKPLRDKATSDFAETLTLAELRNALLPKLISGELRVPDAEKFLAESPV
jgi:type I restriction enzyme S subunit